MASWTESVQEAAGGVALLLEVTPNAKQARFPDGSNPWRQGRIGVRVQAPAEGGRANAEVVASVAAFFEVPTFAVRVQAGQLDRRKTVHIVGLSVAQAVERLGPLLGES